ncbi:MAG: MBL fold metallo-hydrolase [Desulfatiglandaceae bacterium]|jgi:L-ascorbate metabolism protein UlaG (beta-lactamase superfamily)
MTETFLEKIHWLGHDGFRIDGTRTVYFDPYKIESGPAADLILISHDHFDHCSPEDLAKIQKESSVIITEKDSARKIKGDVRVVKPGQMETVEDITVTAVPSYNTDKEFHPRKNGWLGFIVHMDGFRIYHAGDTDFIPEMKDMDVDIALLPVSGTYVMTSTQAIEAAKAIRPRWAIPMHYGTIVGDEGDAVSFQKGLEGIVKVKILERE